jgi:hypothetical protein
MSWLKADHMRTASTDRNTDLNLLEVASAKAEFTNVLSVLANNF